MTTPGDLFAKVYEQWEDQQHTLWERASRIAKIFRKDGSEVTWLNNYEDGMYAIDADGNDVVYCSFSEWLSEYAEGEPTFGEWWDDYLEAQREEYWDQRSEGGI